MDEDEHPNCELIRRLYAARARFERAGELTEGSTRLSPRSVIASDTHALALVEGGTDA